MAHTNLVLQNLTLLLALTTSSNEAPVLIDGKSLDLAHIVFIARYVDLLVFWPLSVVMPASVVFEPCSRGEMSYPLTQRKMAPKEDLD